MRFILALASMATAAFATSSFSCPPSMDYCPWTKACSCPPGQEFDTTLSTCTGTPSTGAWPEPDITVYADVAVSVDVNVTLGTFCATSPYKFVQYDASHPYCQVGLDTITFCADVEIVAEIEVLGLVNVDVEVDLNAGVSAELKGVCAGLAGLYLEAVADAVALFNTDAYGLLTVEADVEVSLSATVFAQIKSVVCLLGLGSCPFDCVSYCTKGCANYIDVVGAVDIGASIDGVVGVAIVGDVILVVDSALAVVSVTVSSLLCIVGRLLEDILSTFSCGCQ